MATAMSTIKTPSTTVATLTLASTPADDQLDR
jgi:hypothetical protein